MSNSAIQGLRRSTLAMIVAVALALPVHLKGQSPSISESPEEAVRNWAVEPHAGALHNRTAGSYGADRWSGLAGLRLERRVTERVYLTGTMTMLRRGNTVRNYHEVGGLTYASEAIAATLGAERKYAISNTTSFMLGAEVGAGWSRHRETDSFGEPTPGMRITEEWGSLTPIAMAGLGIQQRIVPRVAASVRLRYLIGPSEISAWRPSIVLGLVLR